MDASANMFAAYLSTDTTIDFIGTTTGWNNPGGDDTFLGYYSLNDFGAAGRVFNRSIEYSPGVAGLAGDYMYIASFEISSNTVNLAGGILPASTYYDVGPLSTNPVLTTSEHAPGPIGFPDDYGSQVTLMTSSSQIAAIPEPGTIGLTLLGLSVMGLVRKRRRKQ